MRHIDEGALHAWLDHERSGMAEAEYVEIEAHLARCGECARRLAEARVDRDRSALILAGAGPARVSAPDFATLAGRTERARPAAAARRPLVVLAWAASLVAALGVGWMTRDLFRPEEIAMDVESTSSRAVLDANALERAEPAAQDRPSESPVAAPAAAAVAASAGAIDPSSLATGSSAGASPPPAMDVGDEAARSQLAGPIGETRTGGVVAFGGPGAPPAAIGAESPVRVGGAAARGEGVAAEMADAGSRSAASPPQGAAAEAESASGDAGLEEVVPTAVARSADVRAAAVRSAAAPAPPPPPLAPPVAPMASFAPTSTGLAWLPVDRAGADRRLGAPVLAHPGLPIARIEAAADAQAPIVRVLQILPGGGTLTLMQRLGDPIPVATRPDGVSATVVRRGDVWIEATASIDPDSLRALVEGLR